MEPRGVQAGENTRPEPDPLEPAQGPPVGDSLPRGRPGRVAAGVGRRPPSGVWPMDPLDEGEVPVAAANGRVPLRAARVGAARGRARRPGVPGRTATAAAVQAGVGREAGPREATATAWAVGPYRAQLAVLR